mmetsp:Transcript_60164/g.143408  ORF Transcript_60164/g.143408 Transcript_60164/m.143408 type:complete len:249 (+) Transcript_60164:34-780(+)
MVASGSIGVKKKEKRSDAHDKAKDKRKKQAKTSSAGKPLKQKRKKRKPECVCVSSEEAISEAKQDVATQGKKVFVKGLSKGVDENDLLETFGKCGRVRSVKMILDSRGRFRGFAFVTFQKKGAVERALALDGGELCGSIISVRQAEQPVEPTKKEEAPCQRVYVGHIPLEATEKVLRKDFGECGRIENLRMLFKPGTKEFKGTAFITYADRSGVEEALKFNNTEYGNQTLIVKEERPKKRLNRTARND